MPIKYLSLSKTLSTWNIQIQHRILCSIQVSLAELIAKHSSNSAETVAGAVHWPAPMTWSVTRTWGKQKEWHTNKKNETNIKQTNRKTTATTTKQTATEPPFAIAEGRRERKEGREVVSDFLHNFLGTHSVNKNLSFTCSQTEAHCSCPFSPTLPLCSSISPQQTKAASCRHCNFHEHLTGSLYTHAHTHTHRHRQSGT